MVLLAVARSIKDVEHLLLRVGQPVLIKALPHAADNILRPVTATLCRSLRNEAPHVFQVLRECLNGKSLLVAVIAVADKGDADH